jgi:hypothetical protein
MNEFEKIGEDILHGVEWPFKHGVQFVELMDTAIKNEPAAKAAIIGLVKQILALTGAITPAAAAEGTNLSLDTVVVTDAESLWQYVKTVFIPEAEAVFTEVKEIVEPDVVTTTTTTTTTVPVA